MINEVEVDADEPDNYYEKYFDEKTGEALDSSLVHAAMKEDIDYMKTKIDLYKEVPIATALEASGRLPVSVKWVVVNKGTAEVPDVRCRLVARDFKPKGDGDREDLFAAMPPLEAKKMLFRNAASHQGRVVDGNTEHMKLLFIDVKKAHLYGKLQEGEQAFVELPPEAAAPGMCGQLNSWLYGMRPAAQAWEREYTEKLSSVGFDRGRAAPTAFYNAKTQVRGVVHGDDFTFLGYEADLDRLTADMKSWYTLKVRGVLGPEAKDSKEIVILNRTVRWGHSGISYEADEKHAAIICKELGLDMSSRGLQAPCIKETKEELDDEELNEPLLREDATKFRALAARANYLAQDRLDVQFACKEMCRSMSAPTRGSWVKLKRLARYLMEHPSAVLHYRYSEGGRDDIIDVFSDWDWAGCPRIRRSTSGGVAAISGGIIKSWSSTQSSIALSSGEAEYYALTKAAAEGLGIQALAADLGWSMKLRIWVDSTAAKAIAARTGLGRVRHLEVRYLWVQDALKKGKFTIEKVKGDINPGDLATKPHSLEEMQVMLKIVNVKVTKRAIQS
jgi:hypothetical protein